MNSITINNKALQIKEYQGHRVVTFKLAYTPKPAPETAKS